MIVELHLLQNVSPSCLNRDDANAPKDCEFGGYRRARISSQCLKRSVREEFKKCYSEKTGIRSKLIMDRLAEKLKSRLSGMNEEEIKSYSSEIISGFFAKTGKKDNETNVLIFFDDTELDKIAEEAATLLDKKDKKELDKLFKNSEVRPSSYDIALFGRMLAEMPKRNIDGACQVAHAISTNRVTMEFDFFTAVDDLKPSENTGAGMMGNVGFNSSCFYRYAVINVDKLKENLDNDIDAVKEAVRAFIQSSFTAVPTGKQNSFAAHNPPSFAFAVVRENNMPWSLANAFEKPVRPSEDKGLVSGSVEALTTYWQSMCKTYSDQLSLKAASMIMIDTPESKQIKLEEQFKENNLSDLLFTIDKAVN